MFSAIVKELIEEVSTGRADGENAVVGGHNRHPVVVVVEVSTAPDEEAWGSVPKPPE